MKERWQKEKGKAREEFKAVLDKEVNLAKNRYHAYFRRIETYPIKQTRQTTDNAMIGLGRTVNELTSAVKELKNKEK